MWVIGARSGMEGWLAEVSHPGGAVDEGDMEFHRMKGSKEMQRAYILRVVDSGRCEAWDPAVSR